jgi:hypothetical protein
MSEVDRLSNSGLYPMLPIADKRPSRRDPGGQPQADKQPPDKSPTQTGTGADPAAPRPPRSLIDEYA